MDTAGRTEEPLVELPDGLPLYRRIAAGLRRRIEAGTWKPGDRIPTETALAHELGASQGTVRLAILELVKSGLLRRHQGRGTFVLGARLDNSFSRFFRYTQPGSDVRIVPETAPLLSRLVRPTTEVAHALGLSPRDRAGWVRRVRSFHGQPFLLIDSYFAAPLWRRLRQADLRTASLYGALRERLGIHVTRADEFLRADIAGAEEAAVLRIRRGAPVIRIERHAFTFGNRPFEYRRSVGRGDRFQYHITL